MSLSRKKKRIQKRKNLAKTKKLFNILAIYKNKSGC
jgi:hypothetical protein